ncbi:PAS domain S-box protein [Sphingomonas mucosissima]|uniref:histidine kinase n=1 Tax=Sphingomonas mucosissima TaxID=370959 RepID=A0A245ZJI8_9SPHN|nr:PAS domain S-box protein [Sphingomonas mucosissima]OWK29908.1 blue-light-activated protein [Sphingomonas mucosissima]
MDRKLAVTDAHFGDVEAISRINVIPTMLNTVCQLTGMGFAAIARVTDARWIACSVQDSINFGLTPGDELKLETTICHEIRQSKQPVVISDVAADPVYANHHTPQIYGLRSYISVPIVMTDGEFFGTLCAIDVAARDLDRPNVLPTFELFARLIALQLEQAEKINTTLAESEASRESEDRHRQILDSATDFAIIAMDLAGKVTRWNRGAEFILGWREREMLGEPSDRIFTQEDRAAGRCERERQLALDQGRAVDERWHVRASGERFWASGELSPLRDSAGRHTGFVKILRDRTKEHLAGAALKKAQERFETIFDTVDAAFAIVEVRFDENDKPINYRFLEANPAFERQSGVDLRGKWVTEHAPNLEPFWFETYGRVAKTGEPVNFENYAEAFQRWFDVRAVRVGDPTDRQIAIIFNDVTARREAEERLRISEAMARENAERVQLALEAGAIIGTWHWDLPSDQFTVDEAFARTFGLDPALGRKGIPLVQITATVHPDDREGLSDAINSAIARGGPYAHQYRVRRADGQYYWIEANGRVVHAPDGTPLSFPGVLIDVQERRTIEAERDRAVADLRALNETLEQRVAQRTADLMQAEDALRQSQKVEAIGQLTGGVAHDFNNLLTVIRGSVDLLRRPGLSEERRQRYIDAIADTADRATKLTNQLLAFARRQSLKPEVFDVTESVRKINDMVQTLTGARVNTSLRLAAEPCYIDADRSQFDTAIVNMAVNARDAMKGQGELTITVAATSEMPAIRNHSAVPGEFVTVSLTDNGPGISAEDLERIFEPFFTTKGVGEGTGLGLSQVFGFTKQSGGDVTVTSDPGEGATFTMYLPRVEGSLDAPVEAADSALPLGEGACVLVVEDNAEVGRFATQALAELGYRTVWAMDAQKALEELAAKEGEFDAVFSDVMMPGMSGIELGQEIARRYPGLPVVLTSGYSEVLAQSGTHGFALVHKPYSIDTLSRALRKVSRRR